jgi:hypothetical protein
MNELQTIWGSTSALNIAEEEEEEEEQGCLQLN